jgi:3-oxoacyl-[acyl-carrier-protein] synthase III
MRAAILGMGQWLPETIRTNDAWPKDFGAHAAASAHRELADVRVATRGDPCEAIIARHLAAEANDPFLGTKRRRLADDSITAVEAERLASIAALADARVDPSDVDVILSYSAVPDRPIPASGCKVGQLLGANKAVAIGMEVACATIVAQLLVAASLIESGRARTVLLTGSHLGTRAFRMLHPASPSLGDAATAVVVGASERPGILSSFAVTHGEYSEAVVWRRAKEESRWYQAGGEMFLGSCDSEGAHRLVQDTVRIGAETVTEAARRSDVPLSSIAAFACVQPRGWIPGAIAETLGLAPSVVATTFDELAHLGPCGVVTNLIEARRRGLLAPRGAGEPAVAAIYAQGAGFTRASVLLRWVAPA